MSFDGLNLRKSLIFAGLPPPNHEATAKPKNRRSRPREQLNWIKMTAPAPGNDDFSRKQAFPPSGTTIFFENGCSRPREAIKMIKISVPALGTA